MKLTDQTEAMVLMLETLPPGMREAIGKISQGLMGKVVELLEDAVGKVQVILDENEVCGTD